MVGHPNSEKTKKILSEKAKLRWQDPTFREANVPRLQVGAKKRKGIKQSEETKRLKSEAKKKTWQDPVYRKRMLDLYADPEWKKRQSEILINAMNNSKTKLKQSESGKKAAADPKRREKLLKSLRDPETLERKREANAKPEFGKNASEKQKALWQDPEYRKKHLAILGETHATPEYRKKASDGAKRRFEDPVEKAKHKERMRISAADPIHRSKISKAQKELHADPEYHRKLCESRSDPNYREKQSKAQRRPEVQLKKLEASLGGFWYGNVRYTERRIYCEKWTGEFRERCRAFDGYKSVLSGKTKQENLVKGKPTELSVHHVYHQIKACCKWDEDKNGYYVMLNIGTKQHPNIIRYDIKGDPNKFVTLTAKENTRVNSNKLKWIKIFEDLIDSHGGKCYFTKEEMKEYLRKRESDTEDDVRKQKEWVVIKGACFKDPISCPFPDNADEHCAFYAECSDKAGCQDDLQFLGYYCKQCDYFFTDDDKYGCPYCGGAQAAKQVYENPRKKK